MKNFKTLAALLVALLLVFSMGASALAAGSGSIIIDQPVDGETYNIYMMFTLESYDGDSYAYKITEDWREFVVSGAGKDYFSIDANDYVTAKDGVDDEDGAAIAEAALAYAKAKGLTPAATLPKNGSYTASNLDLGYYFVDSSLGALCGLNTTNPSATIVEKNEEPSVKKEVLEETDNDGVVDSGELWGETNNVNVGDPVRFRITVTAKKGAIGYVVTDEMADSFDFTSISSVKANGSTVAAANYTVATTSNGFTVTFSDDYLATITEDTDIVIEYTAVLNDNASVGSTGNSNKVILNYGDESASETEKVGTETYTYEFSVLKYINNDRSNVLAGAGFTLYSDAACSNDIGTEVFTDANGNITFSGLDAGTYYLKETTTPDGYNKLNTVIAVTIDDNGAVVGHSGNVVAVENKTGALLPSTGGIGTTIFYIIGGALVLCAVVVLISKKRMSTEA